MSMNIQEQFNKMALGEKIIIPSGILMLIASFLKWYSVDISFLGEDLGSVSRSGWQSPGAIWSILAVLIGVIMAALVAAVRFGNVKLPELPQGVTWGRLMLGLGAAAALFVIIKFLNHSGDISFGFFLGFIAAAGLVAGGFLTFQEEQQGGGAAAM
ncbi:MAG: hypothetical protein WD904_12985 [Dehalococcoidia bacterium]